MQCSLQQAFHYFGICFLILGRSLPICSEGVLNDIQKVGVTFKSYTVGLPKLILGLLELHLGLPEFPLRQRYSAE